MKGNKFFIDTNIFFRVIAKDDIEKTKDCERLFELINAERIKATTSSLVLAEIVWTSFSAYKLAKEDVIKVIRGILEIKNLKIEDKFNLVDAINKFESANVKFVDSLISSNPNISSGHTKVISYDRDFDRLGVLRVEPKDII